MLPVMTWPITIRSLIGGGQRWVEANITIALKAINSKAYNQ